MNTKRCIDVCNRLLRSERSALEAYDKAINAFNSIPAPVELIRIRSDHVDSIATLTKNVRSMGGTPDLETGLWGTPTNSIQGATNARGQKAAWETLQIGEKTNKRDYEIALGDADMMNECKALIRSTLLPPLDGHIATLEQL